MAELDFILQQRIASDESCLRNLPSILDSLSPQLFTNAPQKHRLWSNRINTLIERPKIPGARWAGLCIAYETARVNRDILVSSAQTWIAYALPILSRDEPAPMLRAAIHLLALLYTSVLDMPEFHRQVITPTVQKFSIALLQISEKESTSIELRVLSVHTLAVLVHAHPTIHIPLQTRIFNLTIVHLSGSYPAPTDASLVRAAAELHAIMHLTGGKARASLVWRKSLDSAIGSTLACTNELTSTYGSPSGGFEAHFELPPLPSDDHSIMIPLALDRLKAMVTLLIALLQCVTARPVVLPIGALVNVAIKMLSADSSAASSAKGGSFSDPHRKALEAATATTIGHLGCDLLAALSQTAGHFLTPEVSKLVSLLSTNLEKPLSASHRLPFLRALRALISSSHSQSISLSSSTFLPNRALKALIPPLTRLLPSNKASTASAAPSAAATPKAGGAKNKKKAKGYEGDEIFNSSKGVMVKDEDEAEEIILTLDILPVILVGPSATPALQALKSTTTRLILALLVSLPSVSRQAVSSDPRLHGRILGKVTQVARDVILLGGDAHGDGLKKGLGIAARVINERAGSQDEVGQALATLSLALHPHVPPTLRSTSSFGGVDDITLSAQDEKLAREALRVLSIDDEEKSKPKLSSVTKPQEPTFMAIDPPTSSTPSGIDTISASTSTSINTTSNHMAFNAVKTTETQTTAITVTKPAAANSTSVVTSPPENDATSSTAAPLVAASSFISAPASATLATSTTTTSITVQTPGNQDDDDDSDDDEAMPEIDMGSDSDRE